MTDINDKLSGFVSLVKLQNVSVLLLAQLLIARFVFLPDTDFKYLLINRGFIFMLLATGSAISAGYIINHFYNLKRDLINRPHQSLLEQKLSMSKKLYLYFFLNLLTLFWAAFISWRAVLFFAVYEFLIWIYFHKIQSRPFWHELTLTFLTVFPFFGVMLFFKTLNHFVIWSGIMFSLLLMLKESIKNHLTLRGDVVQNIRTILVAKGEAFQRKLFFTLITLSIFLAASATQMHLPAEFLYFIYVFIVMLLAETLLYYTKNYIPAYWLIKIIIISGVFALFLL
jgi:4-hydroxybenzoate polyprenyltransferase